MEMETGLFKTKTKIIKIYKPKCQNKKSTKINYNRITLAAESRHRHTTPFQIANKCI